jgi:CheY-like chemotaxis protein
MQTPATLERLSGAASVATPAPAESISFPAPIAGAILPPAALLPATEALPPILVADDDEDDLFFVQRLIRKTGVKNPVRAFNDGTEVVNFLSRARLGGAHYHRKTPLLLFLDLKMRGLGGFGFLEWARQHRELAPLTIVVLTGSSEPSDMARALELGAHRYLVKYPSAHTFDSIVRGVYPQTVY